MKDHLIEKPNQPYWISLDAKSGAGKSFFMTQKLIKEILAQKPTNRKKG